MVERWAQPDHMRLDLYSYDGRYCVPAVAALDQTDGIKDCERSAILACPETIRFEDIPHFLIQIRAGRYTTKQD